MAASSYVQRVRSQFEEEGWTTTATDIRDGTSVVAGSRDAAGGSERVLAMVVTEPESQAGAKHVEYLLDAREEKNADGIFLATTVGLSEAARSVVEDHGIEILALDSSGTGSQAPGATGQPNASPPGSDREQVATGQQQRPGDQRQRTQSARGERPRQSAAGAQQHPPAGAQQHPPAEAGASQTADPVRQRQHDGEAGVSRDSLVRGGLYGACAYVVGFALVGLFTAVDDITVPDAGPSQETVVGWVFYAAHNVDLEVSGPTTTETYNIFEDNVVDLSNLTETVPEILYLLAPIIVLCGTGYLLYRNADGRLSDGTSVAALGASITAGYLPLIFAGTVVFEYSETQQTGGTVTAAPELATGFLVAGILYPAIFGAVGAVAAKYVAE